MKKLLTSLLLISLLGPIRADAQSCLLSYQTKMDQLLPLALIQKQYTGDMSKAKLKYRKSEPKHAKYDTYEYSWPSNRTLKMTVAGRQMEVPEDNRIGLSWINEIDAKRYPDPRPYFKNQYRTATEAEKQKANELMAEKLNEKGASSTEQAAGKSVTNSVISASGYETISGVGDAAAWDIAGKQLVVLKGHTTFKVISAVSADVKTNQELAKKLAAEVLAKCR